MRKKKVVDDTPEGGWECPGRSTAPSVRYASGTKMVRGKLEWKWKPIDDGYLKVCEKMQRAATPKKQKRGKA